MPFLALAVALLVVSGPFHSQSAFAQPAGKSVLQVFDDEAYRERDDRGDGRWSDQDDRGFNLYDGGEDEDEGNSAHGPEDDDGWDIDEYERSERA